MVERLIAFSNRLPKSWWARVLLIWLATRVVTLLLFVIAMPLQSLSFHIPMAPDLLSYFNSWDSLYYQQIFDHGFSLTQGYAKILPTDAHGLVQMNTWAFFPGYPFVVRAIAMVTGLPWLILAPASATVFSFVFALLAFKVIREKFSELEALWAVALIGVSMPSPILQVGYAESLSLVFLAWALLHLLRGQYLIALIPATLWSLTRPGVIAIGFAAGLIWLMRMIRRRNEYSVYQHVTLAIFAVVAAVETAVWPYIAGVYTGRANAYLLTETAWRRPLTDYEGFTPFRAFFDAGSLYFGPWVGPFASLIFVIAVYWFIRSKHLRELGEELDLWVVGYITYLLAVFFPTTSTLRLLLPVFVVFGLVARKFLGWARVKQLRFLSLSVGLQLVWIYACFTYQTLNYPAP